MVEFLYYVFLSLMNFHFVFVH